MTFILLAAYNESADIGHLLDRFLALNFKFPFQIIIVDDGSTDNTVPIVNSYAGQLPIKLIHHDVNRGLTLALRTGLEYASGIIGPDDFLVTMDADNSHDPEDIYKILEKSNGPYDIINGSRFYPGGKMIGVPFHRRLLSNCCRIVLTKIFPIKGISDYTNLYRGYRGHLIKAALKHFEKNLFETEGFLGTSEILIKLSYFKPKATEFPLQLHYDKKIGSSKMKIFKTIRGYVGLVSKNIFFRHS